MQNFVTGTRRVTHSQHLLITTASLSKRGQVYFVSSENEFYFHASKNTYILFFSCCFSKVKRVLLFSESNVLQARVK